MSQPILIQALSRTPIWVFPLFFGLIGLGYIQSKNRKISRRNLLIVPIAMSCFSFYGVASSFGINFLPLAAWTVGLLSTITLCQIFFRAQGAFYSPSNNMFHVPGSWVPLILMMAIFILKYFVGYTMARQLPIASSVAFSGTISLFLGILGGIFSARSKSILQLANREKSNA